MAAASTGPDPKCVLCQVITGNETKLHEDNEFIAYEEKKNPASTYHYIVFPRQHLPAASVWDCDLRIIYRLRDIGRDVLTPKSPTEAEMRFGFNRPFFSSINHLHLHCIAPVSQIGYLKSFSYWPDSQWFIDMKTLITQREKDASKAGAAAPAAKPDKKATEAERKASEEYRKASEEDRKASEEYRKASEEYRKASEEYRKASEEYRKASEEERKASVQEHKPSAPVVEERKPSAAAEERKQSEQERKQSEQERKQSELDRKPSEISRGGEEGTKGEDEEEED